MEKVDVQVHGPGEHDPLFERITAHLPLSVGARLSHAAYEQIKTCSAPRRPTGTLMHA